MIINDDEINCWRTSWNEWEICEYLFYTCSIYSFLMVKSFFELKWISKMYGSFIFLWWHIFYSIQLTMNNHCRCSLINKLFSFSFVDNCYWILTNFEIEIQSGVFVSLSFVLLDILFSLNECELSFDARHTKRFCQGNTHYRRRSQLYFCFLTRENKQKDHDRENNFG